MVTIRHSPLEQAINKELNKYGTGQTPAQVLMAIHIAYTLATCEDKQKRIRAFMSYWESGLNSSIIVEDMSLYGPAFVIAVRIDPEASEVFERLIRVVLANSTLTIT